MIAAKIKKGNTLMIDRLEDNILQMIAIPNNSLNKIIKFSYYGFIESMIQLITEYLKLRGEVSFNVFIPDYYIKKFEKNSQLYRYFFGLTQGWKKFIDEEEEDAKLFLSLLTQDRNNRVMIKRFIKIRKIILKTMETKILQDISVTHSDSITICHMLFRGDSRNKVTKKINTLFISLKRKLINTASVNGAVACQFFMSAMTQLQRQNAVNFACTDKDEQQNMKDVEKITKINYQLSFNQFSNTQKNKIYGNQLYEDNNNDAFQFHEESNEVHNEFQQKQWNITKKILNFEEAKNQLNNLSMKNKAIDEKIQNFGINKFKFYPSGWDQFIRNNKMEKQKLLNARK